MPAYTIASNAGVEGAVVVGKLLEQTNLDIGYDAAKGMESFCLHCLLECTLLLSLPGLKVEYCFVFVPVE